MWLAQGSTSVVLVFEIYMLFGSLAYLIFLSSFASLLSHQETGIGVEQHLHRGRALAAFNHLLTLRVEKLNKEKRRSLGTNMQSDVHALLAPITQNEESLLSAVWITQDLYFPQNKNKNNGCILNLISWPFPSCLHAFMYHFVCPSFLVYKWGI